MDALQNIFVKKIDSFFSSKFNRIICMIANFFIGLKILDYLFDKNFSNPNLYILLIFNLLISIPTFIYNRKYKRL